MRGIVNALGIMAPFWAVVVLAAVASCGNPAYLDVRSIGLDIGKAVACELDSLDVTGEAWVDSTGAIFAEAIADGVALGCE